jgi:predicted alpha/beta hydrolase
MSVLEKDPHTSSVAVLPIKIITEDNFSLHATYYQPENSLAEIILIGSALGIRQEYYRSFARFLAAEGYPVYTFDYRGVGKSAPVALKHSAVSLQQWGTYDLEAMIKHIRSQYPHAKLSYIGHSLSGQLLSLTRESRHIAKVILIAAQHVSWRLWPVHLRFGYAFLVYFLVPLISQTTGYYPGKILKVFRDLPRSVALEWAGWSRCPEGMFGFHSDEPLHRMRVPVLSIGFSDDAIAPARSIKAFVKKFSRAALTHWQYNPGELGVKKLGHSGFFKPAFQNVLWEPVLDWLRQTERFDKPLISTLLSNQMECL